MGTELLDLSEARGREAGTEDIGFCGVLGCQALLMSAKFSGIRAHVCGVPEEPVALTMLTGLQGAGSWPSPGIPGRSGSCLWGLRRGSGSRSCLMGSGVSVAEPVTPEFPGKEAIALAAPRGVPGPCPFPQYRGGGSDLWGPRGSVAMLCGSWGASEPCL